MVCRGTPGTTISGFGAGTDGAGNVGVWTEVDCAGGVDTDTLTWGAEGVGGVGTRTPLTVTDGTAGGVGGGDAGGEADEAAGTDAATAVLAAWTAV